MVFCRVRFFGRIIFKSDTAQHCTGGNVFITGFLLGKRGGLENCGQDMKKYLDTYQKMGLPNEIFFVNLHK